MFFFLHGLPSLHKSLQTWWTSWSDWPWLISVPSKDWSVWKKLYGLQTSFTLLTLQGLNQWIQFWKTGTNHTDLHKTYL